MAVEIIQSVDPVSRVIFDTFGRTLDPEWLRNILGQTYHESVQIYSNGGIRLSLHTFNRQ